MCNSILFKFHVILFIFMREVIKVPVHVFLTRESSTKWSNSLDFSTSDVFPVLSPAPVQTNSDKEPIN